MSIEFASSHPERSDSYVSFVSMSGLCAHLVWPEFICAVKQAYVSVNERDMRAQYELYQREGCCQN